MKIALITPKQKNDYLTDTILDGLLSVQNIEFVYSSNYETALLVKDRNIGRADFMEYTRSADLILFFWGKNNTDLELANEVNRWNKTIYIDGSELGKNNRLNPDICKAVEQGTYDGLGRIDTDQKNKCALYFRREKPYQDGIKALPFGIESKYSSSYSYQLKKDIDFTCIFGQDIYPILRRDVARYVKKFSRKNGYVCVTDKTRSRQEFYDILGRTKVGISVGGGGYDTVRFWEILGNNCLLMTEKIAIYEPGSKRLDYKRIYEFEDFEGFKTKLTEVASILRNGYDVMDLSDEYEKIMNEHSSKARVLEILEEARNAGIIK